MARGGFNFRINNPVWNSVKEQARLEASRKAARATARRVQNEIRSQGRVNSGKMVSSVTVQGPRNGRDKTTFSVGSDLFYFWIQNDGTGPIYPVRAKFLRFKPKGSSTFVFAKRTRGVPAGRFMEKASRGIRISDFF